MATSEREWRLSEREYTPLTDDKLDDILDDTGRDSPYGYHTDADVYAIARDLKSARKLFRDLLTAQMLNPAAYRSVQDFLAGN
jgi:hypothetical protein